METKKTKPIRFFLMHSETGQRYPLAEQEVVMGRSSGAILFPQDTKLSGQHCRILPSNGGYLIHDLRSNNGTFVDGFKLDNDKIYALKIGSKISIGQQVLTLNEASFAKPVKRKKKSKKTKAATKSDWPLPLILLSLAALVIFVLWNPRAMVGLSGKSSMGKVTTPFEQLEDEINRFTVTYRAYGEQYQDPSLSLTQKNEQLHRVLIPQLQALQLRLEVIKPQGEFERRYIEVHQRLIKTLSDQMNLIALSSESPEDSKRLSELTTELETIHKEAQKLKSLRRPAKF